MISVVIPVYNDFLHLKDCIDSLAHQQKTESFEVIISDDGSTDETVLHTQEYCRNFTGFKIITSPHRGPAAARNAGVCCSQGDIILFTDADCIPADDWVEKNRSFFVNNPCFSAVKGIYKTRQKSIVAKLCQAEFEERYVLLAKNTETDFVDTYSAGIRREAFLKIGGFDESYTSASNEDVDFSFRLHKAGYKIGFSRDIKVYHTHPDSWEKYAQVKFWRAYYRMKVYRKHVEKIKKDSYTPLNMKLQIVFFPFLFLMMLNPGTRKKAVCMFLMLCMPFCAYASADILLYVPFFLFIRTGAFVAGILHGIKENWL